ncbi:hypothetical protein M0R45_033236 [Rubus argutus]|uniref:eIF3 subunit M C-terminal helix domain-containing protein n=1 Tax=Rubus argutus TaxID=59490 RepID=A0AAW1WLX8_RUBAR
MLKYSLAYQLLKTFLTQRLDAYSEFQAANSTLLKSYGLVLVDCITKMMLISLVDLGSDESGRIPYNLIRDALQLSLDYLSGPVGFSFSCCCNCDARLRFFQEQWHTLKTKLASWWGNIANVISTVQANRPWQLNASFITVLFFS